MKINNKTNQSFVCKTCQTQIHKKCVGLRLSEICDIKNSKTETHWECQTCMSDEFPFTFLENKDIVQNTFNSVLTKTRNNLKRPGTYWKRPTGSKK